MYFKGHTKFTGIIANYILLLATIYSESDNLMRILMKYDTKGRHYSLFCSSIVVANAIFAA